MKEGPTVKAILFTALQAGEVTESAVVFFIVGEGEITTRCGTPVETFESSHGLVQRESLISKE